MQEPINRRNKTIRMLQSKKMFDYTYKKMCLTVSRAGPIVSLAGSWAPLPACCVEALGLWPKQMATSSVHSSFSPRPRLRLWLWLALAQITKP
jgi:hypothetical protein